MISAMSLPIPKSIMITLTKLLFTNFIKTQSNLKRLSVDYRNPSYNIVFYNIKRTFINFSLKQFVSKQENESKKVTITFERHDGVKLKKVVKVGTAINTIFPYDGKEIPNFGSCGGCQECATCHVIFPKHLIDKLKKPSEDELDIVCCANEYDPIYSRLGCCVEVTEEMDGAVLFVPEIIGDRRDRD